MAASCRRRWTERLGANDNISFRSSDIVREYSLESWVVFSSSTGPSVSSGKTWLRISLSRRTGKAYIRDVRCWCGGIAVLEDDMADGTVTRRRRENGR